MRHSSLNWGAGCRIVWILRTFSHAIGTQKACYPAINRYRQTVKRKPVPELKDIRTKSLLHIFETRVESPSPQARKAAQHAAAQTGDLKALSSADLDVLAKALEYRAVLATDDYTLQTSLFTSA